MFGWGKKRKAQQEAEEREHETEREAIRLIDPFDSTTSMADDQTAILNMTQVFDQIVENLERIDMNIDPEQGVGMTDVLTEDTLVLIGWNGMSSMTLYHFANTATCILQRRNPQDYAHLTAQKLDPGYFGFHVSPESLAASQKLISLCLQGQEVSHGDVPEIDAAAQDEFVEMFAALFTFFVVAVKAMPRASGGQSQ